MSRRGLLAAGAGVAAAGGLGAAALGGRDHPDHPTNEALSRVRLPAAVPGLPDEQHAWEARLAVDGDGNSVAGRHQRLLLFELAADPSVGGGDRIERALRLVEAHAHAHASGARLVTALGWAPSWFAEIAQASPVPQAGPMADTEAPTIDAAVACLHLAGDDPGLVAAVDRALTGGAGLPGQPAAQLDLRAMLRLVERRTGFVGAGLPRAAQSDLGDHEGVDVPARAPLFMGFKSGMRRSQASEAAVTIDSGRWRGGTTMHVSRIALTLPSWYASLSDEQRAARMHGPGVRFAEAASPGAGLDPPTSDIAGTARRHGVVGHAQAAAGARRRDKPVILRRDFNGVERGQPVVHFVALQRTIEDFVTTRKAMNADAAVAADPAVGTQVNNGINEWLSVHNRANFLVPPRAVRAFPGLRPAEVAA